VPGCARDETQRRNNLDKCNETWYSRDRTFLFMQALGPAVGFILTVSSLVGALHPALRSSNNLDGFLTGIHVAMISTFIGLLLRIIALWGERFNNELYERALLRLPAESEPNPKEGFSI
jgi:biopolymer transport protein ExbB/TolQ